MQVTLIHNRKAGDDSGPGGDHLIDMIRQAGHEVVCHPSRGEDWEKILDAPADVIAIAGGDGTVGKVARRMIGKNTPMTILPVGTANNISRAFHMHRRELPELIEGWQAAKGIDFDVGRVEGPWGASYFIEGMSVGLVARMMLKLNAMNNRPLEHLEVATEKVSFSRKLFADELLQSRAKHLKVVVDGDDMSGAYILVGAMIIQHIGPNLHLAPYANLTDGMLDVVFLSEAQREEMSEYLLTDDEHLPAPPDLTFRKCRQVEMTLDGDSMHLDDKACSHPFAKLPKGPAKIDVRIVAKALKFLVPASP